MTFDVQFSDVADMEAEEALVWLLGHSPDAADRWQQALERAVRSLGEFPLRCPLAPENERFPVEVRQLLFGPHRLLFTLIDSDGDGADDAVQVLHVRHSHRAPIGEED